MPYHSLTSEKYLTESLANELQQAKKIKRQQKLDRLINILATISVIVTVILAIQSMPLWLPGVVNAMYNLGIL